MKNGKDRRKASEFSATDRMHHRVMDKYLSGLGVHRASHMLLMSLHKNGALSQSQIAKKLDVSTAAVAVKLKKLEKDGLIVRVIDKGDNRINQVTISKKGEEIVKNTIEIFDTVDTLMLKDISEEELAVFNKCLMKINKNLKELYEREDNLCKNSNGQNM